MPGEQGPQGLPGPPGDSTLRLDPETLPQCSLKKPHWNINYLKKQNLQYETTTLTTDKKVLLVKSYADIYTAKRVCDGVCGTVFLPESFAENQEAAEFLLMQAYRYAWIRASDRNEEGVWKDFETLEDLEFTNWRSGQPDDYDEREDYALLDKGDGDWADVRYGRGGVSILCELPRALQ